jgi:hypothetical protein
MLEKHLGFFGVSRGIEGRKPTNDLGAKQQLPGYELDHVFDDI